MITVSEQNVAMDAGRRLDKEHRCEGGLKRGVGVLAPQEAWQPERVLHNAIAPERGHAEVGEADHVLLGLLDFALPGIIVSLVRNDAPQDWMAKAIEHFFHHAKRECSDTSHPQLPHFGVLVAGGLVLVAPSVDHVRIVQPRHDDAEDHGKSDLERRVADILLDSATIHWLFVSRHL